MSKAQTPYEQNSIQKLLDDPEKLHQEQQVTHTRNQIYLERAVAKRLGLSQKVVRAVFNESFDVICEELMMNNKVKLHGKGCFYLSRRSSRIGRNPQTGEEYMVPEHVSIGFKPSSTYNNLLRQVFSSE